MKSKYFSKFQHVFIREDTFLYRAVTGSANYCLASGTQKPSFVVGLLRGERKSGTEGDKTSIRRRAADYGSMREFRVLGAFLQLNRAGNSSAEKFSSYSRREQGGRRPFLVYQSRGDGTMLPAEQD